MGLLRCQRGRWCSWEVQIMADSNADTGFRTPRCLEVEGIGKSLEFLSLDDWKKQSPEGAD